MRIVGGVEGMAMSPGNASSRVMPSLANRSIREESIAAGEAAGDAKRRGTKLAGSTTYTVKTSAARVKFFARSQTIQP
jgi:hypothetical protein